MPTLVDAKLGTATRRWTAMGTSCTASLVGPGGVAGAARAEQEVARLEAQWSRFRPTSEVASLNAAPERAIPVSPETLELVALAVSWWRATGGLFDPTVVHALRTAGYVADLASGTGPVGIGTPAAGCGGVDVDQAAGTVRLGACGGIDLGGIGKGRAADLVAAHLARLHGGLIDLGGDLRVWGVAPEGAHAWPIAVEDPRDGSTAALLALDDGAVATSTTLRRRWSDGHRAAHHLIDPRTGRPTDGDLVAVTVVAGVAAGAEVLAKAAVVAGTVADATRLLEQHGVAGLLAPAHGTLVAVGGFDELRWEAAGR